MKQVSGVYSSITPSDPYYTKAKPSTTTSITVSEIDPRDIDPSGNPTATTRSPTMQSDTKPMMSLNPCSSTGSLFMFAQGSSIVCVEHDTLKLFRRFEAHAAEISIIAADTSNESGDGHVISLDIAKEAVVWDPMTGDEISRFTAYEEIRVATFLRNGTIALGDNMGNIILFDPQRSEAVSCRTFQIPICALAPSADSKFFAIGYQNGAVIIATLMPTFVIHHTLASGSATAFPITVLAWHGSSSRQKSDMLATQSNDGDLKVWSIAKPIDGGEAARVVRVLKKADAYPSRRNWMSWSRNGRILQYSDYDTSIWDVRTKKVTWEAVMSRTSLLGINVYAPKGLMFTLDKQHTVQQFNLYPPQLMLTVQHAPSNAPPSPPMSVGQDGSRPGSNSRKPEMERSGSQRSTAMERSDSKSSKFSMDATSRAIAGIKRDETRTPMGQIAHEYEMLEALEKQATNMSRSDSMQSTGSGMGMGMGHQKSASVASSIKSFASGTGASDTTSLASPRGFDDMATPRGFHPLSQEIGMSPITPRAPAGALRPYAQRNVNGDPLPTPGLENNGQFYDEQLYFAPPADQLELFPNLRDKLATITYKQMSNERPKYDDERRREMFSVVFGFEGDAESLIREEISQHPARSIQSLMLRLWLHDLDANALNVLMGSETLVPSDWLFIALAAMGGQKSWQQTIRVFIMRLIQKNDVHNAVMCFLMIGERENAIEQYVTSKRYMEAVLLTALLHKDWRRLSILVRKWGEHAAEHGEGGLAMRCFACTENIPDPVPTPAAPAGGHSRKSSLSGSIKSPTFPPQKTGGVLQKPGERPTSPRVGASVRHTAARFFGFGDKEKGRDGRKDSDANIMDMPWNRPIDERNASQQPSKINTNVSASEGEKNGNMIISGPINTTPVDGRVGTPALPRVTSPGIGLGPPGRIASPALSMNGSMSNISIGGALERGASPRPPAFTASQLPHRIESPGPDRLANASPAPSMAISNFGPSRVASPAQEGGLMMPPQRTGSALSQRKPPGLHIQLASFQDVLAGEPSPELTRQPPKLPVQQLARSVSKLNEVEVPSEDEKQQPVTRPTRSTSVSSKTIQIHPSQQQHDPMPTDEDSRSVSTVQRRHTSANNRRQQEQERDRRQEQERDRRQDRERDRRQLEETYAEDSYDSGEDDAERNLAARRRSLERLEREMANVRLERARSISRQRPNEGGRGGDQGRRVKSPESQTNNNTIRGKPKQPQYYETTEEEYSEDDRARYQPQRKVYNGYDTSEVSEVSEVEDRYYSSKQSSRTSQAARVPSRNQNRTPRVASRTGHRAPPRVPSRNQTKTPKFRDETEEEDYYSSQPRRVASRNQNRTPKPRGYDPVERTMSPPQRGASRNVNRTPKPPQRYDEVTEEDEESELDTRPRRKTPAPRQQSAREEFTESEADDYLPPPRQASRNQSRNQTRTNTRYITETESEYEPIQRTASRNAMNLREQTRSPAVPPIPRTKTPLSALNRGPSRSNTPASHTRKPSVSRTEPSGINKTTSPVPEYDRHDYDLPALAAAAAAAKAASPGPERNLSTLIDTDRKPLHPNAVRAKLNALPVIPQSPMGIPSDLPTHPAFQGNMRATTGVSRRPTQKDDIKPQTVSVYGQNTSMVSPGRQALRVHAGPGGGDMITVGLEGVVMDDRGGPVETAPPPRAGRATPMGQKI